MKFVFLKSNKLITISPTSTSKALLNSADITDLKDNSEGLFEAVGRTVALREFLDQNNLTKKYSVTLVILLEQYKKLKK